MRRDTTRACLGALGGALFLALQQGQPARAQSTTDALAFFKNYFITGDYVVGGVGLRGQGVNGLATGNIPVSGVPEGADVVAAFLYWQVVAKDSQGPGGASVPVTFKGHPLKSTLADGTEAPFGKQLGTGSSPCWSSGGGTGSSSGTNRTYTFRADVLRFLEVNPSDDPVTGGKFIANGAHEVQLPDGGGLLAIGASLVVIYRNSSDPTLNAIVIYDGSYTMDNATTSMFQKIEGFYDPAPGSAKLTHIVGSGQANKPENLRFDGLPGVSGGEHVVSNPFVGAQGESWDNYTFTPELTTNANVAQVTTSVDRKGLGTFDCLTWGAVIYRTPVTDSDGDGLLDRWETATATSPVIDPTGQPLPVLSPFADPLRKDVFVEVGFMDTGGADLSYGGVEKAAHTHLPTHETLNTIGTAFAKKGIAIHFDVGADYPQAPAAGPSAENYLVRTDARGGERIDEMRTVCQPGATDAPWVCQYANYPGTVGWKTGFLMLRDEVIGGAPVPAAGHADPCDVPGNDGPGQPCERRFDRNRKDIYRYALFAHGLGLPKSDQPCLNGGQPAPVSSETGRCSSPLVDNPGFHTPSTNTGVGDFPGGDAMVTLGAFPDTSGKPGATSFMQASTLMHELGHGFERRHGGEAQEPNCKPTYFSVMNYLYQLRGLLDDSGRAHLDFSGDIHPLVNESSLSDGAPSGLPYRMGWYAPAAGSYLADAYALGQVKAAAKHCNGSDPDTSAPAMIRIDARSTSSPIDWNADGDATDSAFTQDVSFSGVAGGLQNLAGSNDWGSLLLNQSGARRNTGALFVVDASGQLALGPLSLDTGRGDLGRGDLGRGDLGRGDLGRGDLGRGDLGRGDLGRGDLGRGDLGRGDLGSLALGRGDLGRGDLGGGDFFQNDPRNPAGELDLETAGDLGKTPPLAVRACVIGTGCVAPSGGPAQGVRLDWKAPHLGDVVSYTAFRVPGPTLQPNSTWTQVGNAIPSADGVVDYVTVDIDTLVNGARYTYFAVAVFADGVQSDVSNLVTITAVINAAPGLSPIGNQTISADTSAGPLAITVTDESAATVALSGSSSNTTLVPNSGIAFGGSGANRTVTVTPAANQTGTATITITATDASGSVVSTSFLLTVNPAYTFTGFLTPLATAGTDAAPTNSGTLTFGKAVPVKWQLALTGVRVSDLGALASLEAFPGNGAASNTTCSTSGPALVLFDSRPTGSSTYRYDARSQQFIFNWDTTATNKANCYRVRLTLNDGSPARVTIVRFR